MDARLDGVVFRGQSEGVEAHRLEHFEALHLFETRVRVRRAVIIPMSDVELRSGRIGEHFEDIPFFIDVLFVEIVLF